MRWKIFIPSVVIIALIFVFCQFFLSPIVKNIVISIGQMCFSAKVEIDDLKLNVPKMSIKIARLRVANKNNPWKNLVEIGQISFRMRFLPILSKKIVIDEMSLSNLMWGTQRKTSGALPEKKVKKIEKVKSKEDKNSITSRFLSGIKEKTESGLKTLPLAKDIESTKKEIASLDIKKIVGETDIQTTKVIEQMQKDYNGKYENYENQIQQMNINQQIKEAGEIADKISSLKLQSMESAQKAQQELPGLNEKRVQLEETVNNLNVLQNSIRTDFAEQQKVINELEEVFKKDYEGVLSRIKLPELKKGSAAEVIFGRAWLNRVDNVMNYIHLARKYMPPTKKAAKKTEFPRSKGTDVVFHKKNVLPGLLIEKIYVSGTTGGEGKDNSRAVSVEGEVREISSDQKVRNIPATININGKKLDKSYLLKCRFDRTQEIPEDIISLEIKNLDVSEFDITGVGYLPKIENGSLQFNFYFALKDDYVDSKMNLNMTKIKFASQIASQKESSASNEIIEKIVQDLKNITLDARLYGKTDELKTEIDSNIDDVILNRLRAMYGEKISEVQKQIKSELEKMTGEKRQKFIDEYSSKKENITKLVSTQRSALESQRENVNKNIDDLKLRIDGFIEQEKKKKEEKIKEEVAPRIEKLLDKNKLPKLP